MSRKSKTLSGDQESDLSLEKADDPGYDMLRMIFVRSREATLSDEALRLVRLGKFMEEAIHEAERIVVTAMQIFAGEYRYSLPSFPRCSYDLPWRRRYVGDVGAAMCERDFRNAESHAHDRAIDTIGTWQPEDEVPTSLDGKMQAMAVEAIVYTNNFLSRTEDRDEFGAWMWWTGANRLFGELMWEAHKLVMKDPRGLPYQDA